MKNFDIVDVHAHIYPDKIAAKACLSVGAFYNLSMSFEAGTVAQLLEEEQSFNIKKIIVHSVATSAKQVVSINDFLACQMKNPIFFPFATLHPDMEKSKIVDEIARTQEMGFHGIKLHPDCQKFSISGERGRKLLDCIPEGLPVLLHAGDKRYNFSNPELIVEVAKDYPHITFVAAHFGGYTEWEKAEMYLGCENVFFDTSSSLFALTPERAKQIIETLGEERFMFGTDFPMWGLGKELERFFKIDLSDETRKKILSENAKRNLKIEY